MKYPIGIQSFDQIREDGYVYVDKTALVYDLIRIGMNFSSQTRIITEWKCIQTN